MNESVWFKGSDLNKVAWCYMLPLPPETRPPKVPGPGRRWPVSSGDRGGTPAGGTAAPLWAPPAPLRDQTTWRTFTHR